MSILKVLLLTIIIMPAAELTLKKKFELDEIIFRTIKHPLPYYDYVAPLFDSKFCTKSILAEDLVDEGIIVDQSSYKKYFDDVVNCRYNFIIAHVKSIVTSDGDDCERKMEKVVLKTICKTCFSPLINAKQFNTANTAYHADEDRRHEDINDSNCFIVYLDINNLYQLRMEIIDAIDWTKIALTIQPDPVVPTTTNNSGSTSNDITCLVAAMDQQYKDAHDLKEETLEKYDATTKRGVPEECIAQHDMYNKTNNIMTKLEMKKFKNVLTPDQQNLPQDQNFVTIGKGGNQYCINRDGSLFHYLKHQSPKNYKEYVKEFPFIYEWSPEGWADFRFRGMYYAYFHFAWVPSYNLVRKS